MASLSLFLHGIPFLAVHSKITKQKITYELVTYVNAFPIRLSAAQESKWWVSTLYSKASMKPGP